MAPLSNEIRPVTSCCPPHIGPAVPEVNSVWFKLFIYEQVKNGPPSLLLVKGTRLRWLPKIFEVGKVKGYVQPRSQGFSLEGGHLQGKSPGNEVGLCLHKIRPELIPVLLHEATRNISTPSRWDASPSQGYPYPFVRVDGERHCESKVSCPRTQHNVPDQCSNPDPPIQSRAHKPWGHHASIDFWGYSCLL